MWDERKRTRRKRNDIGSCRSHSFIHSVPAVAPACSSSRLPIIISRWNVTRAQPRATVPLTVVISPNAINHSQSVQLGRWSKRIRSKKALCSYHSIPSLCLSRWVIDVHLILSLACDLERQAAAAAIINGFAKRFLLSGISSVQIWKCARLLLSPPVVFCLFLLLHPHCLIACVSNYYRPDNEVDGCKKLAHFTRWMKKSGVGNNEPLKIMIHDLTHVRLLFVLLFEACLLHWLN